MTRCTRETLPNDANALSERTPRHVEPYPRVLRTHARALLASHSKRHSGKRGRGLDPSMCSVGFIVDSGCSWH
eukprot:291074-Pleurochrysis_carterae.AAC.1